MFYYNLETKEVKRNIKERDEEENSLVIEENVTDKALGRTLKNEHRYSIDKRVTTFIFFVLRPLVISLLALGVFTNLLYDFYEVIKINKAITLITFGLCVFILGFTILMYLHLAKIFIIGKGKPNLKLIEYFSQIQYVGYFTMVLIFILYWLLPNQKTTYLYACLVHLGTFSFYSYAVYLYMFLPLKMLAKRDMKFYRNDNDKKLILVEIKE
jgi:hypothetical protein